MSSARIEIVAAFVLGAACVGCNVNRDDTLVVGGKNFEEQTIVGEMAAQLIEQKLGLRVERMFNLAANLPCKLIQKGEIDLYLDYTGTGYMDILAQKYEGQKPAEIFAHVKKVYPEKFGVEWLKPLGFNNTYTLTMRRAHAEELGVNTISDLANHTDLVAGFDPSFLDRDDGYPGLVKHYGFAFTAKPKQLEIGLMYRACKEESVDVVDAFATDGRIRKFDLKVLKDDKQFFPPYDAAFNVRVDALKKHPKLRATLGLLAGTLDDETMQELNHAVTELERKEADVAHEFLVSKGLLSAKGR